MVIIGCLFLRASYVEASTNARRLGTLLLLFAFLSAGYDILLLREPVELYTMPLVIVVTSFSTGTWMYCFDWFSDWFKAKRARHSDSVS